MNLATPKRRPIRLREFVYFRDHVRCGLALLVALSLLPAAVAFAAEGETPAAAETATPATGDNQLTDAEKEEGWILLFNGSNLDGWKNNNDAAVAAKIEQGAINPHRTGGYLLVYEKPFGDFVLKCDVKMSQPSCNSGIFLRTGDLNDPVYSALEVQVYTEKTATVHDFGAIYDLVPPSRNATNGPGKWDSIEVRCHGPLVTVSINGEKVASMNVDEWDQPGRRPDGTRHKFRRAIKDFPREGYLGLQDHGQDVWFKNVKLKQL